MYIHLFNYFFSKACLIINFYVLIMYYNTPRQPAGIFSFFYCPGSEPLVFDPVHETQTPSLVSAHEVCKRECCTTANLLPGCVRATPIFYFHFQPFKVLKWFRTCCLPNQVARVTSFNGLDSSAAVSKKVPQSHVAVANRVTMAL